MTTTAENIALTRAVAWGFRPTDPDSLLRAIDALRTEASPRPTDPYQDRAGAGDYVRRQGAAYLADQLEAIAARIQSINSEPNDMRISEEYPSSSVYLAAKHLPPNQEVGVTIADCVNEHLDQEGDKAALVFVGKDKKLLLNKTNLSVLVDAFGDETDDWRGKKIVLFVTRAQYQGQLVPAIRIRIPAPPAPAAGSPDADIPW